MSSRSRRSALAPGSPWKTASLGVAAVVALFLAATGCGGRTGDAAQSSRSAEAQKVRADYLAYWDAFLKTSTTSDPNSVELANHAAGGQLIVLKQNLASSRELGIVAKGEVKHQIRDTRVDGLLAYVLDCVDVKDWVQYDAKTGDVVPGQWLDRPSQLARFILAPRDGQWLVTGNDFLRQC